MGAVGPQDDTFVSNALHFFRLVMKGFLQCGDAQKAFATFQAMQSMRVSPTFSLMKSLLRGFGLEPLLGVALLETLLGVSESESESVSLSFVAVESGHPGRNTHTLSCDNDTFPSPPPPMLAQSATQLSHLHLFYIHAHFMLLMYSQTCCLLPVKTRSSCGPTRSRVLRDTPIQCE